MKPSLVAIITTIPVLLLIGVNIFQTIIWTRRERLWIAERTRLLDTIVAHNASEFRVRQTTKAAHWESDDIPPRRATPNDRPPRPMPIGLGGEL